MIKNFFEYLAGNKLSTLLLVAYFFRQIVFYINPHQGYFIAGNFDLFYLFGIIFFFKNFKRIKKEEIIFPIICILFFIMQVLFIGDLDILRAAVNISKLIVCYFVMLYFKQNWKKYNIEFICKGFSFLCTVFLAIAVLLPNSLLWRHNDYVNKYNNTRLQLLYTEPSELGLHIMPILLLLIYMFLNTKDRRKRKNYFIFMLPLVIALILTRSMGAIVIGAIAVVVLISYNALKSATRKKKIWWMAGTIVAISAVAGGMVLSNNQLYLRTVDTFLGKDTSNNYRIAMPMRVVPRVLVDTGGLGAGFGNIELSRNVEKYKDLGLASNGIINSYMNIIAESGIFGILLVVYIIVTLLKNSLCQKSSIKLALSVFIIAFQIAGTYFVNPFCWIVYGIVLGDKFVEK